MYLYSCLDIVHYHPSTQPAVSSLHCNMLLSSAHDRSALSPMQANAFPICIVMTMDAVIVLAM